jgi:tyrosine-specific transport protein
MWCIALAPPVIIVMLKPGIFIAAIAYAGIYCIVLLAILPILMAWFGRYRKNLAVGYQVFGGKVLLAILLIAATLFLLQGITSMLVK